MRQTLEELNRILQETGRSRGHRAVFALTYPRVSRPGRVLAESRRTSCERPSGEGPREGSGTFAPGCHRNDRLPAPVCEGPEAGHWDVSHAAPGCHRWLLTGSVRTRRG